ncbi:MAG TPA: sulfite exporter TauE/SafE family protein [Alphaproteobacteria bacterium]
MSAFDIALLFIAGLFGGAGNALAGGGTFFTFPAMLETGLSAVVANASNAVALYPGRFPSVYAGKRELMQMRSRLARASIVAALGSLAGAWLLLVTKERVFASLIPWLLLFATSLFAFGSRLVVATQRFTPKRGGRGIGLVLGLAFEAAVAVYGGYFGAGAAFMVMAGHAMMGISDVRQNVALKNLVITVMTTVSVATFVIAGAVAWRETLVMMAGALPGGYLGARLAQRLDPMKLRGFILAVGAALTVYYFAKVYFG